MFVTIIYYFNLTIGGEKWELGPFRQFPYISSVYKDVVIEGKLHRNMEHYKVTINKEEVLIPSFYSKLEEKEREFKDSYNRYKYDKLTGVFDQPKDWEKDYEKRTGQKIKKKADFNGENIFIPKSGRSGSLDKDELQDSGDKIFEV
jgi:hypothetical protein